VLTAGAAALYYFLNGNTLLAIALLITAAFKPFIVSFHLFSPYLNGKQQFRRKVLLEIFQAFLPFVALVCALFLTKDPLIIIFVYFASHTISSFLAYQSVARLYTPSSQIDPELKNYSKHVSVMNAFVTFASHFDKILVWKFLGAVPVAAYAVAQAPIAHMSSIAQLVHTLAFPKLVNKRFFELRTILPQKIQQYFLVASMGVVAYIVAAPFLFGLLFPNYPESVLYSQLLALGILAAPRALIGQAFSAHRMKKELYILNLSTPLVRILLLLLFIPFYGILGTIAALLLTEVYTTALVWILFSRSLVKEI
jgi:O-antigen/teichoic acid export membrane protein